MDARPVAIVGLDGAELLDIACVATLQPTRSD
jgi:hypothetical protein